jgi:hypothetical protein
MQHGARYRAAAARCSWFLTQTPAERHAQQNFTQQNNTDLTRFHRIIELVVGRHNKITGGLRAPLNHTAFNT